MLTAAHCISHPLLDPLLTTVVIGRESRSDAGTGERIQAKRVILHSQYGSPADASNDVALIELGRAPASAVTLQVAGAGEEDLWAPGDAGTILGWGATSEGGAGSDVLRQGQVPVRPGRPGVYASPARRCATGWRRTSRESHRMRRPRPAGIPERHRGGGQARHAQARQQAQAGHGSLRPSKRARGRKASRACRRAAARRSAKRR